MTLSQTAQLMQAHGIGYRSDVMSAEPPTTINSRKVLHYEINHRRNLQILATLQMLTNQVITDETEADQIIRHHLQVQRYTLTWLCADPYTALQLYAGVPKTTITKIQLVKRQKPDFKIPYIDTYELPAHYLIVCDLGKRGQLIASPHPLRKVTI